MSNSGPRVGPGPGGIRVRTRARTRASGARADTWAVTRASGARAGARAASGTRASSHNHILGKHVYMHLQLVAYGIRLHTYL